MTVRSLPAPAITLPVPVTSSLAGEAGLTVRSRSYEALPEEPIAPSETSTVVVSAAQAMRVTTPALDTPAAKVTAVELPVLMSSTVGACPSGEPCGPEKTRFFAPE